MTNNNLSPWDTVYTTVINLPREKERRLFMEQQLSKAGIPHVFFNAIDGNRYDFKDVYSEDSARAQSVNPLTASEKGCALSHRLALETFLTSDKPYALIMEDDIAFGPTFPNVIATVLAAPTKPWNYLQFNYSPVGWQGVLLWWFLVRKDTSKRTLRQMLLLPLKGVLVQLLNLLWGTRDMWNRYFSTGKPYRAYRDHYLGGCYLITREAAQALITLNTPLIYTADRIQNIARRAGVIKHYLYSPRLVRQKRELFSSSINNDHFGEKVISY